MRDDVGVAPLLLDEGVQLVTLDPGLRQHVPVAMVGENPGRIAEDQVVHLIEDGCPLRTIREPARLLVERVEVRQAKARVVRGADVLAVE